MGEAVPYFGRFGRPGEAIAMRFSPPRRFAASGVATAFAPWPLRSAWPGMGMCC